MSLEKQGKMLVSLYKKEKKLQEQLSETRISIEEVKTYLQDDFEKIGLRSSFSG